MSTANAVTFDGSNDYLTRGADLTNNGDTKLFTFSFWWKRPVTGVTDLIWNTDGNQVEIFFNSSDDTIQIRAESTADILAAGTSAQTDTASWHHIMGSFDLGNTGKHLYVDGVSDYNEATFTDDTIDCTRTEHSIGANVAGSVKYTGDLAVFWLDFGQFIDLSVASNRAIFYSAGKVPTNIANSTDGAVGGLNQPIVFMNNPAATWVTNLGDGEGFTDQGSIASTTGPEIQGNIILRRRREFVGAF